MIDILAEFVVGADGFRLQFSSPCAQLFQSKTVAVLKRPVAARRERGLRLCTVFVIRSV